MGIGLSTYRPLVGGVTHMVSTGHYLATAAGYRILEQGGNAIDAGVAAGIAINVTLPQYTSFGGVAPIIIHHAPTGETREISGLGRWPAEASIDYFHQEQGGDLPHGVMRTVTPAAPDAWLTALERYGTMSFEQVVAGPGTRRRRLPHPRHPPPGPGQQRRQHHPGRRRHQPLGQHNADFLPRRQSPERRRTAGSV